MNPQLDSAIDRCAGLMLVAVMSPSEREGAVSAFGEYAFAASKLLPDASDEGLRWLLDTVSYRVVHSLTVRAETMPPDVGEMVVRDAPGVFDKVAEFIDTADLGSGADGLAGWLAKVIEWPGRERP